MKLHEIRQKKAAKVAEARNLLSENSDLSEAQKSAFDAIKSEITALEADESRAEFVEGLERRATGEKVTDQSFENVQRQVSVVEVIRNAMEGRSQTGAAAEFAQETERRTGRKAQGVFVPMAALESRSAMVTAANGAIIGTDHRADQYIEPFRNSLLARRLGVRVLSGLTGNLSIPKYGTGTTTGWVAENTPLPTGNMSFGSVGMSPKHAGGITEMSRQMLQQTSPDIEQLVRSDLSFMLAQALDTAMFHGTGTNNQPTGILNTAGIQTGTLSAALWQDTLTLLEKLDLVNAPMAQTTFVGSTRVKAKLAATVKTPGTDSFLLDGDRIAGRPAYFTNQLQDKAGTPNKGRLIAGDFSQILLGIWSEMDLLVNPFSEGAYAKGNVLIRAMSTVDIAVRHPQAFVLADDVNIAV